MIGWFGSASGWRRKRSSSGMKRRDGEERSAQLSWRWEQMSASLSSISAVEELNSRTQSERACDGKSDVVQWEACLGKSAPF